MMKLKMIFDMSHACDVIREMVGGRVNSLTAHMGTGGNNVPLILTEEDDMSYVVRRLTPTETERFQGFPDEWTEIGDWVDEKGKKRKTTDSNRYKCMGNSIAIPQHFWYLSQMAEFLPEGATLGSLFDGVGGFPIAWEEIHGKGTARWASEIEPFCIAVTKKRFGEE